MKKLLSVILLGLFTHFASAQVSEPMDSIAQEDFNTLFYVLAAFVIIVLLLLVVLLFYVVQILNRLAHGLAFERAEKRGEVLQQTPGFWVTLNRWLTASTPVEKEETIISDHSYDGIRELDNHLPPWWTALLYGSIVWGAIYLFVYHVSDSLPLSAEEYANEVAYAEGQLQKTQEASEVAVIDENTVVLVTDETALQDGKKTFDNLCASCHRQDGGGDIGPNLTDAYWLHGGSVKDVFRIISQGVQGTNMIAWSSSLSPKAIQNVSGYLLTLQGTSPPNAKEPEGEEYTPQQVTTEEVKSEEDQSTKEAQEI